MLNRVWSHIHLAGEREEVVNLASLERPDVEIEPLEVEDEVIRYVLETGTAFQLASENISPVGFESRQTA
jgi:hypothetical protein